MLRLFSLLWTLFEFFTLYSLYQPSTQLYPHNPAISKTPLPLPQIRKLTFPRFLSTSFHILDTLVIIASFTIDVLLHGTIEEIASLVVILRLWRVFKIIEEFSEFFFIYPSPFPLTSLPFVPLFPCLLFPISPLYPLYSLHPSMLPHPKF